MSHPEIFEVPAKVLETYDRYLAGHVEKLCADARRQIEALNLDCLPEIKETVIEQAQDSLRFRCAYLRAHGRDPEATVN